MNLNKKGMIAVMDAMIFIAVLGIVVSMMFVHSPKVHDEPLAATIHNDMFRSEHSASEMFDIDDFRTISMQDAIAVQMISGEGNIIDYIEDMLRSSVPVTSGFKFTCILDGLSMTVGEGSETPSSEYSGSFRTVYGTLETKLQIF